MRASADKHHLLVTTNSSVSAKIKEFIIKNSNKENPLDIKIYTKLSFESHVASLCKKSTQNQMHLQEL